MYTHNRISWHHQQTLQESIASRGFQHPKSRDSAFTPLNSCHQLSRNTNNDCYLFPHAAAQSNSHFETFADECVYNRGPQRGCHNPNFGGHFLKGSNLNNTRLQQQRHLNCAISDGTVPVTLKVDARLLKDQFSLSANEPQTSHPLLYALLKGNTSDFSVSLQTPSSAPRETNASRHCISQKMKTSPETLNYQQTRMQNHSRWTHSTPHQQQVTFPFLNGRLATDRGRSVGETEPLTDDQILDFIAKRSDFLKTKRKYELTHSNKDWNFLSNEKDSTLQSYYHMGNPVGFRHLPTKSASDTDYVERQSVSCVEQCSAAAGQALQEDRSRGSNANADLTPKSKTGDCTKVASQKHLTGTVVTVVENTKHVSKNDSAENGASVDFDLPVKIHLDVNMATNSDGRLVLSDYCEDNTFVGRNDESFRSKWCDKYLEYGMTTLHYSLTALKELITSLEKVETIAELDNFSKAILQQYWNGDIDNLHLFTSTEYPQIMAKVATCSKTEDESPVVLTAVTLDKLTEKKPDLMLNCCLLQEEYKSVGLNINPDLDEMYHEPGVSWAHTYMTENRKGVTGTKPCEAVELDNVQGVADRTEDLLTKSSSLVTRDKTFVLTSLDKNQDTNTKGKRETEDQHCHNSQEIITHSKLNSSTDQTKIHNGILIPTNQSGWLMDQTSCEGVREDAGSVLAQTDLRLAISRHLSLAISRDKGQEPYHQPESKNKEMPSVRTLKDPKYEDISDDEDMSQVFTNLPKTEHEQLNLTAGFEDPQYEDISGDENPQIESLAVERASLIPEPSNRQSPFEKGYRQLQVQTPMKTESISDEQLVQNNLVTPKKGIMDTAKHSLYFVEAVDDFDHKSDSERHLGLQTNHCVSCGPSHVQKDGDETDNQMNADWIIIPVTMSDLRFEPDDEGQDIIVLDDGETEDEERQGDTNPTYCDFLPASHPASASSQIEVFDTLDCFLKAKAVNCGTCFEMASGRSTPEHEIDSEGETHMRHNRRKSYSDPDDSGDTEDSCDYPSATKRNYLTVSRKLLEKRTAHLPSETDDSSYEKESEHEAKNVQKGQSRGLDKLGCMQQPGALIEAKVGPKNVRSKTTGQKVSKKKDAIILNSDKEDKSDQHCKKKAKRKISFSSCSVDRRDPPYGQQRGHPPENVGSQYGTVKDEFQKNRLPYADLAAPQHQSKQCDSQFEQVIKDASSDLSHSTETSGKLIEPKAGPDNVQHDTNRKKISVESSVILDFDAGDDSDQTYEKPSRSLFPSGLMDSGNAPCAHQKRQSPETVDSVYGAVKKKPRQMASRKLVSHDSERRVTNDSQISKRRAMTEKTHLSVSKDTGDTLFGKQSGSSTETVDSLFGTANKKPQKTIPSSEGSAEKRSWSVGREEDFTLGPKPVTPVIKLCQPNDNLILSKESEVHRWDKDEAFAPKTPKVTGKKTDSCENDNRHLYRKKQGRSLSKSKPSNDRHCATKSKVQTNIIEPRPVSRPLLLPNQGGSSTSASSLTSKIRQLSKARHNLASSRDVSQSETIAYSGPSIHSMPVPGQHSSSVNLKRSHSFSNPSILDHPNTPTKGSSFYADDHMVAKEKVKKDWQTTFFPTRRDKTTSVETEEALRTTNYESRKEARPRIGCVDRAPRQRHNPHESVTPLMKRTKDEARQWTKAINRDTPRKQRSFVGKGYKWSEKHPVARPTRGSLRERKNYRSPRRPWRESASGYN